MDRRQFIMNTSTLAAAAAGIAATGGIAFAADNKKGHEHMHSAGHKGVANSAFDCVSTGETCLSHCLESLSTGDKTLAKCATSVQELLVLCEALGTAASRNSKYLKQIAKISLDACKECEDECRKHEKEHQSCKDCADACAACAKECKALLA